MRTLNIKHAQSLTTYLYRQAQLSLCDSMVGNQRNVAWFRADIVGQHLFAVGGYPGIDALVWLLDMAWGKSS